MSTLLQEFNMYIINITTGVEHVYYVYYYRRLTCIVCTLQQQFSMYINTGV